MRRYWLAFRHGLWLCIFGLAIAISLPRYWFEEYFIGRAPSINKMWARWVDISWWLGGGLVAGRPKYRNYRMWMNNESKKTFYVD